MLMQCKEKFQHYNSFWFPCCPILIEEKYIYKTHTQIFAFGPRHLISTDNLNYNGKLSFILVQYSLNCKLSNVKV